MGERQSGFLMPSYGQHKAGGTVVEAPFYWAMSNYDDATLYQTVMSNRGYMQGAEFRHLGHNDAAANFRFFYLDDGKQGEPTNHRYWAAGMINQPLPDDWLIRGTLDRVSDANYLSDFNFGYMGLNRYSRELLAGLRPGPGAAGGQHPGFHLSVEPAIFPGPTSPPTAVIMSASTWPTPTSLTGCPACRSLPCPCPSPTRPYIST